MAVDRALQVHFTNAREHADEEGVDRDDGTGMRSLDMAFAELGAEAFKSGDLLGAEFDLPLDGRFLQP